MTSAGACFGPSGELGRSYSFWVFGLLHPRQLSVTALRPARVHCRADGEDFILEPGYSRVIDTNAHFFKARGPEDTPVSFMLEAPNVLSRRFWGELEIRRNGSVLAASVTMPAEVAVGGIVGAELPLCRAPLESLMAQAIVSRSFLLGTATARHDQAFFCDTTHCQFLRSPAAEDSPAASAVAETAHMVLTSERIPFAAAYSAACGGRTEGGARDGFFYQSVNCAGCRRCGLPRRGHGWGLCQEGAMELARRGAKARDIVGHYFPRASLRYL